MKKFIIIVLFFMFGVMVNGCGSSGLPPLNFNSSNYGGNTGTPGGYHHNNKYEARNHHTGGSRNERYHHNNRGDSRKHHPGNWNNNRGQNRPGNNRGNHS